MEVTLPSVKPALVYSPHPLLARADRQMFFTPLAPGESLLCYLLRHNIPALSAPLRVCIEGYYVPEEMWGRVYPHAGNLITVRAVMHDGGGGDGKNPLATILTVALIIAAPEFGLPFAASVNQALVLVAGSYLINNVLAPPPKPRLSDAGGRNDEASPTYALSGGSNRARPYEPLPLVMGTHRQFPDEGSKTYSEFEGDEQFLYQTFNFGLSDAVLSDFRIGNTPVTDFDGVTLQESGGDGALSLFPGNVDTLAGGELTAPASWITRTSSTGATALAIEIFGDLYFIDDSGSITTRTVILEMQARVVGAPVWTPLEFVSDTAPLMDVSSGGGGGFQFKLVRLSAEAYNQQVAGPLNPGETRIINSTRKPVRRTYFFHVASGQYEVRVRRVTADETDNKAVSSMNWTQLRTYQPDTADYTGQKRVALKIKASGQLNGQVDQFSGLVSAQSEIYSGYVSLLGSAGSVSTPDGSLVSITSDASLRGRFSLNDWTPAGIAFLVGQWGAAGQRARKLEVLTDGKLRYSWSVAGTTVIAKDSTVVAGVTDGSAKYVMVTHDIDNGAAGNDVRFWTSDDSLVWTQLGATVTTAGTTSVFNSTAAFTVGAEADGTTGLWAGKVFYADLRATATTAGAPAVKLNASEIAPGVTSHTSSTSEVWTLLGTATIAELLETRQHSNPAWWVRWFAKGKTLGGRRAFGAGLPDARIELENLKAFSRWCVFKNLTFNAVLDRPMSCEEALNAIARLGRGQCSWSTGKLGAVWDAPNQTPVAVFGMPNIAAGSFEVEYVSDRLSDEVVLNFVNPALDWQQDFVRAPVPGVVSPASPASVELWGCTDPELAGREANLTAANQAYRRRRIRWATDVEGLVVNRGDVVLMSHDLTKWGKSGRIISGTTTNLLLDQVVTFTPATSHFLMLRLPDGTFNYYPVQFSASPTNAIVLTSPLPEAPGSDPNFPAHDYMYFFDPLPTPGRKVKITDVEPVSMQSVRVTAFDENPSYYLAENNVTTSSGAAPADLSPALTNLSFSEELLRVGNSWAVRLSMLWDTVGPYDHATVRVAVNDELLQTRGSTFDRRFELVVPDTGIVTVEITGYGPQQRWAPESQLNATYTLVGKDFDPSNVASLAAQQNANVVAFFWPQVSDPDLAGYEIRFSPQAVVTSMWDNAQVLTAVTRGTSITTAAVPPGAWKFWIKAVDTSKNYSEIAATTTLAVTATGFVEIFSKEQAPDWLGTKTNMIEHHTGVLVPDSQSLASDVGWEVFDQAVYSPFPTVYYEPPEIDTVIDADVRVWSEQQAALLPGAVGVPAVSLEVDYRLAAGSYDGFEGWTVGSAKFRFAKTRIKVDVTQGVCMVQAFKPHVDAALRKETGRVTIGSGGTVVTFANPFHLAPNVQITAVGNVAKVAGQDGATTTGFTARMRDMSAGGAATTGDADWAAEGV